MIKVLIEWVTMDRLKVYKQDKKMKTILNNRLLLKIRMLLTLICYVKNMELNLKIIM